MRYRDPIPTFRAIYRFARRNMTAGGKTCLLGMLLSLIGLVYLETGLIYLFSALLSLLVASAILSVVLRPRLVINTLAPASVMSGEEAELEVYFRNPLWRPAYDLTVSLTQLPKYFEQVDALLPFVAVARRDRTTRVTLPFRSTHRGVFPWPRVRITSAFPFNLFRFRQTEKITGELIVLPRYLPLQKFDLSRIMKLLSGQHDAVTARIGASEQYFGNREYQSGMAVRRWDYCSWARLGTPIVREYQETQHQAIEFYIDTFVDDGGDDFDDEFEAMLSVAMAITDAVTSDRGYVSRLLLGDDAVANDSESVRDQLETIALQLALVQPKKRRELRSLLQSERDFTTNAALLFAIFRGWDDVNLRTYEWLSDAGCIVKPLVVVTDRSQVQAQLPPSASCLDVASIESGTVEIT